MTGPDNGEGHLSESRRQMFETLGESLVRDDLARGGRQHIGEGKHVRLAASEWLAEKENARIAARGSTLRLSIVGPVIALILVIAGFAFVAAL